MTRNLAMLAVVILIVGLGTGFYLVQRADTVDQFADCRDERPPSSLAIGGPFELTDHNGNRVTETDVIDGPTLFYFGYTYCPDVCPFDTTRNAEAVSILEEQGIMVKPVFVTIDPARDTPEVMAEFTSYLHERMLGLTGSPEDIAQAIKAYRVYAAKNGDGEYYLMDHSTSAYLMAPEYGFIHSFAREVTGEEMAEQLACFVERL